MPIWLIFSERVTHQPVETFEARQQDLHQLTWIGSSLTTSPRTSAGLWNFYEGNISNFLKPCVKPRPIFSNLVLNPDQSGSQERTRPWWREWRERDLFSTPPTHLVCSSHCVTRAPLLYFIRSWVALSFKVVSQSVRHAWHHYNSPLFAIYKGMNVLYWPSIINYQLLPPHSVLYWPSTQLHHLVTHSWANWI